MLQLLIRFCSSKDQSSCKTNGKYLCFLYPLWSTNKVLSSNFISCINWLFMMLLNCIHNIIFFHMNTMNFNPQCINLFYGCTNFICIFRVYIVMVMHGAVLVLLPPFQYKYYYLIELMIVTPWQRPGCCWKSSRCDADRVHYLFTCLYCGYKIICIEMMMETKVVKSH